MKTVKMSEDCTGSPDGCCVVTYKKGETYPLLDALADAFVNDLKVAKVGKAGDVGKTAKPDLGWDDKPK
jgi:hypothetical protein